MRKLLALALVAAMPVLAIQPAMAVVHKPVHRVYHKVMPKKVAYSLADGKSVYTTNCATCHGALSARRPTLPNAADFFAGKFRLTHGNPALMEQIIKVGGAKFGHGASPQMPPWGAVLTPKQIADVAAFERSLHK